ncbi:MAG: Ppx/GppA phosphatase family protein [Immundisolibacteraceae bacterium]|nr:Ppx/GppA phosphatase family protein [Immundisolibacteraceae bacterium]
MLTTGPHHDSLLAAVDLGSNSFHLLIARVDHGEISVMETRGQKVQLAADFSQGKISDAAISRGLECLKQFRQVIDGVQPDQLRVVGTNTLRAAKNAATFIRQASAVLGQPVEIISGREEARLVYLGVAHTLADDAQSRLVIDIGGGSTEFIIGQRFEPILLESLHIGCVSFRDRFFTNDKISAGRFEKAYQQAYLELRNIGDAFLRQGWSETVGSSGTLNAISKVLRAENNQVLITRKHLEALKEKILKIGSVDSLGEIAGLRPHRQSTFAPGLAIACALFDALEIDQMRTSPGALREGVVYDLIGRMGHEDVRQRTVAAMMSRYSVDQAKAARIERYAKELFQQTRQPWNLTHGDLELLCWAAQLHEIGLSIAHNQFHKHGQYLIDHADLPGFSFAEQASLALLVRCHRRKFQASLFIEFDEKTRLRQQRLCILLRLAMLFKYANSAEGAPVATITAENQGCNLVFQSGWLARHPLTQAELEIEQGYLKSANFDLVFN